MKALVGAFKQEKALVGAFSVIVQPVVEPMDRFTALLIIMSPRQRGHVHLGTTAPRHVWLTQAAGGSSNAWSPEHARKKLKLSKVCGRILTQAAGQTFGVTSLILKIWILVRHHNIALTTIL